MLFFFSRRCKHAIGMRTRVPFDKQSVFIDLEEDGRHPKKYLYRLHQGRGKRRRTRTRRRRREKNKLSMVLEIVEEELAGEGTVTLAPPLLNLNHVSFVVRSVSRSVKFYEEVLGFVNVKRPSSFKFHGAWLYNYGIGIHLLQCNSLVEVPKKKGIINPKDNHISFQCSDISLLKRKLEGMGIEYVTAVVEDSGIQVDQLFFHDPDGYMVEICNCENIPMIPLSSGPINFTSYLKHPMMPSIYGKGYLKFQFGSCAAEAETVIMETLVTDMMDISF